MPIPEHAVRAIRNLPSLLKFLECDRSLNRSLPVRILCGDDYISNVHDTFLPVRSVHTALRCCSSQKRNSLN